MQQIERYGVIALVFLLVTIVAVSFWGDSKSPGFWSRLTGKAKKAEVAQTEPLADPNGPNGPNGSNTPVSPTEKSVDGTPPLTPVASNTILDTGTLPPTAGPTGAPISTPPVAGAPTPLPPVYEAPIAPKVEPAVDGPTYVVKKGDTLGLIAARSLGSASRWTEIRDLNNGLEPKNLKIGATIHLPATANLSKLTPSTKSPSSTPTTTPTKSGTKPATKSSGATYVVQKGDSLRSIAAKKLGDGGRWKEISAANPGLSTNKLVVGKTISLPADAHPTLVAAAAPSSSSASLDAMDKPRVR